MGQVAVAYAGLERLELREAEARQLIRVPCVVEVQSAKLWQVSQHRR